MTEYHHAYTLRFHNECKLHEYNAVFGGFLANALLKGYDSRRSKLQRKISFIYEMVVKEDGHSEPLRSELFNRKVLLKIYKRRFYFG